MNSIEPEIIQVKIQDPNTNALFIENQAYLSNFHKFCLCIESDGVPFCCCGCSLRQGTLILCALGFILVILGINVSGEPVFIVFGIILSVIALIGFILLQISIFNKRVKYAYWGYMILFSLFWVKVILHIIAVIYLANVYNQDNYIGVIISLIIIYIIDIMISFYSLFIFFSYCKKLSACDFNGLLGIYNNNNNQIYLNVVPGTVIVPNNLNAANNQQVPYNNTPIFQNNLNNNQTPIVYNQNQHFQNNQPSFKENFQQQQYQQNIIQPHIHEQNNLRIHTLNQAEIQHNIQQQNQPQNIEMNIENKS